MSLLSLAVFITQSATTSATAAPTTTPELTSDAFTPATHSATTSPPSGPLAAPTLPAENAPATPDGPPEFLIEILSAELSPLMLSFVPDCAPEFGVAPSGILRIATLKWSTLMWTPVAVGLGLQGPGCGGSVGFGLISSELGAHYRWGADWQHGVSVALGLGAAIVLLDDFYAAGGPVAITPSVRYQYRLFKNAFIGGGVRAVAGVPAFYTDNGSLMTAFVEVGWIYEPNPEVDATAQNSW